MLFKQTFLMLWQNKYFAFLSHFGIGITVAVIMAFFIVLENKTGNIAPEVNADRMVFLGRYNVEEKHGKDTNRNSSNNFPREIAEKCLLHLNSAERITLFNPHSTTIPINDVDEIFRVVDTDKNFWKLYLFHFLSGRGFTDNDFDDRNHVAVISRYLADKLYPGEDPIGKQVIDYRIIGIVENAPSSCINADSHIWTPCFEEISPQGYCEAAILLKKGITPESLQKEVDEACNRYNLSQEDTNKKIGIVFWTRFEQLMNNETDILSPIKVQKWDATLPPFRDFAFRWFGLLGAFLLIIISNQTGVNLTRLRERSVEMGIRKAFGAGRKNLMLQLFAENVLVCFSGGLVGTLLAWWVVYLFRMQVFSLSHVFFPAGLVPVSLSLILFITVFTSLVPLYRVVRSSIPRNLKEE